MKPLHTYIILQFAILSANAGTGQETAISSTVKKEAIADIKLKAGATEFRFRNFNFNRKRKDSFLVIYDRYDRSGAGIIKKVFYPGQDETILVNDIPSGKYFITVQRLGRHRQKFEKVSKVKSLKCETIVINIEDWDECTKEQIIIPKENTDFSKLSIFSSSKPSTAAKPAPVRKSRGSY